MKRRWAFSLFWINLSVAVVVLIQIAGNQIASGRELLHMLAYSLVYANLTGVLGVLVIGGLAERLVLRKLPLVPIVAVGIIFLTAIGCLLAQSLLMVSAWLFPRHSGRSIFTPYVSRCRWLFCSAWGPWSTPSCGSACK
jgi:hypothetical protein